MSSLCLPSVASPKTRRMWQTALLGLSAALFGAPATTTAQPAREPLTFEKHVLPIFRAHCLRCHGAEKQSGALDLRTKATLLAGGESGPALVPGSPTGRSTARPSQWLASRASSICRRSGPMGCRRLSSALRTRYWTVFLCSVRRSAVAL